MADAIMVVPREEHDTTTLTLSPASVRIVETRDGFRGVLIMRGTCGGLLKQGESGRQVQIPLDNYGRQVDGLMRQAQFTLDKQTGGLFKMDRRYEILVRELTPEEVAQEEAY